MIRMLHVLGLLFLAWMAWAPVSHAQTVEQLVQNGMNNSSGLGQSFVAPANGVLTSISFDYYASFTGSVVIYEGAGGSGLPGSLGTPAYSQAVHVVGTDSALSEVVLSTPFPVVAGASYTVILDGGSYMRVSTTDTYPDGTMVESYGTVVSGSDMRFRAQFGPTPPAPVPTLSEWAMMAMGMLLTGGTAVWLLRRGRMVA